MHCIKPQLVKFKSVPSASAILFNLELISLYLLSLLIQPCALLHYPPPPSSSYFPFLPAWGGARRWAVALSPATSRLFQASYWEHAHSDELTGVLLYFAFTDTAWCPGAIQKCSNLDRSWEILTSSQSRFSPKAECKANRREAWPE